MYLYCYARSQKAKETGKKLLSKTEGEWIESIELFAKNFKESAVRADGAIVMILPVEAAVKLLTENINKANITYPVFMVNADSRFAGLLKRAGYNNYEILNELCDILGAKPLTQVSDRSEFAPNLKELVKRYDMVADKPELLDTYAQMITEGRAINVYSDLPLYMAEPTLDSLSYSTYLFRSNQKKELGQAYVSETQIGEPAIFITCSTLPDAPNDNILTLVPRQIVLGLELTARADADYALESVKKTLTNHGINPDSVSSIAVSAMLRTSEAVTTIADALKCNVVSYDSRILKAAKIPFSGSYAGIRNDADAATALACLASDNGRLIVRRAGDKNNVILTAAYKKDDIWLTT